MDNNAHIHKSALYLKQIIRKPTLENTVRCLAGILIAIITIGFLIGSIKTFIDLRILFSSTVSDGLEQLLINALNLLAVIEVIRTLMSYLADGRVKVRYVVDTVLIIMLNEVISFWFVGNHADFLPLLGILMVLIIVRILTIKFSPDTLEDTDKDEKVIYS